MIRWLHLIVAAYGFWLPNDPRGSWSVFVGSRELYKFGAASRTNEKRSLAHDPHDRAQRLAAKQALKYPVVRFNERQRELIAEGFAQAVSQAQYEILACCIGHDHAHAVIGRRDRPIQRVAQHLKSKATMALTRAGAHPLAGYRKNDGTIPTPWSVGCWSVFIDNDEQLERTIQYVQRHAMKEGMAPRSYPFLVPTAR